MTIEIIVGAATFLAIIIGVIVGGMMLKEKMCKKELTLEQKMHNLVDAALARIQTAGSTVASTASAGGQKLASGAAAARNVVVDGALAAKDVVVDSTASAYHAAADETSHLLRVAADKLDSTK